MDGTVREEMWFKEINKIFNLRMAYNVPAVYEVLGTG